MSQRRATFQDESGQWLRICRKCGETKPLKGGAFHKVSSTAGFCNRFSYNCKACEKIRRATESAEIKRRHAERIKRAAEADPIKERERLRKYRAKLKANPARYLEHLENRRIYEALRREQKGGMLHAKFQPAQMSKEENHLLPAKPLYVKARGYVEKVVGESRTVGEGCESLGITSREYRRWVNEEQEMVRWETADKLLTAMGLHWWDVWDESEVPERIAA